MSHLLLQRKLTQSKRHAAHEIQNYKWNASLIVELLIVLTKNNFVKSFIFVSV